MNALIFKNNYHIFIKSKSATLFVHVYVCVHVCICMCTCACVCMCVCARAHTRRVLKGHLQRRGTSVASLLSLGERLKTSGVQSSL